ncbi:MAG TPA: hypothetical protein VJ814_04835 [Gaiellaceae bacterium]|nr:hypothetical protein [Gaiellaceae bacterium]
MSRKRLLLLAPLGLAALAAAGVALAGQGGPSAQAATATFTATNVTQARLTTCSIGTSDTFASTLATYAGTATSSDARLNGTIRIRATSLVDTNTGIGRVVGVFHIRNANGVGAHGAINAVVGNGDATGAAIGRVNGPGGQLAATLTSPFDPAAGFGVSSAGSLGGGTSVGTGVVLNGPFCHQWHKHPLRWLRLHLHRHHG